MKRLQWRTFILGALAGLAAYAHCDALDGPVVHAARAALASGDVNKVLIWVEPAGEAEVKQAFAKALDVRKLNAEAQALADRWFFETVVRIHRAGEGAPYDGLKPAGRDLGPAIPAADRAIETGSMESLSKLLLGDVRKILEHRFHRLMAAKTFASTDLQAGREYVAAYVDFLHFTEKIHQATAASGRHEAGHEH